MKLSIVIAVLDSHEIVRRQILHFQKMLLSQDIELILVDDGSNPPLNINEYNLPNLKIIQHHNDAAWTQPAARNLGVKMATGDMLVVTDIDHIITKELLDFVLSSKYDVIRFKRQLAVLDENGDIIQNKKILKEYGVLPSLLKRRNFKISPHSNSFAINRELYLSIGGVSEAKVGSGKYPNREEIPLKYKLKQMFNSGQATIDPDRALIYMIPNGRFCGDIDYNPFGLFNNLSRK